MSIKLLHFADAHIDMANFGRHDPETGLPIRVTDFLRSLDQIVDTAISEQVDLVIFAGDAYKDRNPRPTFQKAWGERIMRLSSAGIPTVLLVGNHDVSPAAGRAHTMQEFNTLDVPNIYVADRIGMLYIPDLPIQIITIPWISRSSLMTREQTAGKDVCDVVFEIEAKVADAVAELLNKVERGFPTILTAHASVQGAVYGSERAVMLGNELVLGGSIITDPRLDYVALGHIHKHQSLNADGRHPPVIYPGSIERVDFGEIREQKGFIIATVDRGHTDWEFFYLNTRPMLDIKIETSNPDVFMNDVLSQLPTPDEVEGAICRVQLSYPADWEPLVDESAITARFEKALSLQIQKHRDVSRRSRLDDVSIETLDPEELLQQYWNTIGLDADETSAMQALAREVLTHDPT